jgi:ribosomal protein S18 acetylase RimI-like enzyme
MDLVERLQAYLRHAAHEQYEAVPVPPFTAFFHRTDDLTFFNYAIPDGEVARDIGAALDTLRAAFRARQRRPRWEYLHEFVPGLAPLLETAGFVEEARLHLMICTPDTLRPVADVGGLTLHELTAQSSPQDAYDFMLTQRQGFNPGYAEQPTEEEARQFLANRDDGASFLARLDGEPASAGGFSAPHDGICEVVGIATRTQFRQRGIASALTALATRTAFGRGVEVACLTAGDERAGRMYEHVGYRPFATTLFYIEPEADQPAGT